MQISKPKIFIGSSTESLSISKAFQQELDYLAEVEIWSQGVFGLGNSTLETLCEKLDFYDYAIFILSPDDFLVKRDVKSRSPRDNVIFEIGLFIGKLGRHRTFIVYDRDTEINIPTDLDGITFATYSIHSSGNIQSSIGAAATTIINSIEKITNNDLNSDKAAYHISKIKIKLLNKALENLEATFSSLRFARLRFLFKEKYEKFDVQGDEEWNFIKKSIPERFNFEQYLNSEYNFPNIFLEEYKTKDISLCPALFHRELFNFYWLRNYETKIHFEESPTVLMFFRDLAKGFDQNFKDLIVELNTTNSYDIIDKIVDLREDKEYKFWTNLTDGISDPGYFQDNVAEKRVYPFVRKGISLRDVLIDKIDEYEAQQKI